MVFLTQKDAKFVEAVFREYYNKNVDKVYTPEKIDEREFGYFPFSEKIMVRHLYFDTEEKLKDFLKKVVPLHVYHSAAFYRYPSAPMEEKEWLGADLIFDIDADHLRTRCRREHDFKICPECLDVYGREYERCIKCNSQLIEVEWVCELCHEAAKEEVYKLLDFLETDLGFQKIKISFSGNRGYHVVVTDENIRELGQLERKEIVDYITGTGILFEYLGLNIESKKKMRITRNWPEVTDPGWRSRIAKSIVKLVIGGELEEIIELPGEKKIIEKYSDILREFSEKWSEEIVWDSIPTPLLKILGKAALEYSSAKIDVVVTSDIHRLIRLGNTLNGKSGLIAKIIDIDELEIFDPFYDAVALPMDREVKIRVVKTPRFKFSGIEFPEYRNEVVKLPLPVAVLLISKNMATISNVS
ncbi:MAG: DNA primase small subunit PriS [Nitrososphaerota archaeon]|nr:DNA primase small subunit PriS [Candidatus Geocrenenecus dongiae]